MDREGRDVRSGEGGAQRLRHRDRAVLAAGAPDGDRHIAAALPPVALEGDAEQLDRPLDELRSARLGHDVGGDLVVAAVHAPEQTLSTRPIDVVADIDELNTDTGAKATLTLMLGPTPVADPKTITVPAGGSLTTTFEGVKLETAMSAELTVHVAGAVRRPGVYRLPARARVVDAVRRAGGARRRADLAALNLAAKVEDGRQVLVPLRGAGGAAGGEVAEGVPLNLNTATAEQLDELDGVGPAMAASILKYREEHGGFGSIEELGQVSGIGEKRLAALRDL